EPGPIHLKVCYSDSGYCADNLRAKSSVELIEHGLGGCRLKPDQDMTRANVARRAARRECLRAESGCGRGLHSSCSENKGDNAGEKGGLSHVGAPLCTGGFDPAMHGRV